jgi:hypothetical protein
MRWLLFRGLMGLYALVLAAPAAAYSSSSAPRTPSGHAPTASAAAPTDTGRTSVSSRLGLAAAPVVAAAGDIASRGPRDSATARVVRQMKPRFVLALGDMAYPAGSRRYFQRFYVPTWCTFKGRTRPTPGNHDLRPGTGRPPYYFRFFADQLPNVHRGRYYAFNVGRWRLYSLNCEIVCGPRSRQVRWLRRDLATAGRGRHKLAYVHRPRYSCGKRGSSRRLNPLWNRLLDARTDIVLAGHSHNYQRFPRMNANNRITRRGILSFVVGTGGVRPFPITGRERKEGCAKVRHIEGDRAGVLKLRLGATAFRWTLVAGDNDVLDTGVRRTLRPS